MKQLLIVATLLLAQAIPTTAQSREKGLDPWFERTLVPYVQQQLTTHPRFRNETVMFVILRDNKPTPVTNALALSLRDRLLEAAVDTSGITIGWQQGRATALAGETLPDCALHGVHYFIGIELQQTIEGRYEVDVRALDLEDRTWVAGFGKRWLGQLGTSQRQALRQQRIDQTFLGNREVPFTLQQTDLLAAQLARQLSCDLRQQLGGEYVVTTRNEERDSSLTNTVELISNNLAAHQALTLAAEPQLSNAVMEGKAHQIDGALYQYWLTITPQADTDALTALSASAYIVLPDKPVQIVERPTVPRAPGGSVEKRPRLASIPNSSGNGFLAPLDIGSAQASDHCEWPCSVLRTRANSDSIVVFLEHQANHGLVRLSDSACRHRTAVRIVKEGGTLRFPIARPRSPNLEASETLEWQLDPAHDTFYAVVVADAELARELANLVDRLPQRCSAALRPGLQDAELQQWLDDFARFAANAKERFDWRALQVRDIT